MPAGPLLSILCVTRAEAHAWPFLQAMSELSNTLGVEYVVAADRVPEPTVVRLAALASRVVTVQSQGYIESVLDTAVSHCRGAYVLRLDDDERCSPAMIQWLWSGAWTREPAWAFATAGLWGDAQTLLVNPELWPQYHTRLTIKARAAGRSRIHAPDPLGRGAIAPVVLEHHKFVCKPVATRLAIRARYNAIRAGAGKACHSIPEVHYDELLLAPLGDGTLREFHPDEIRRVNTRCSERMA